MLFFSCLFLSVGLILAQTNQIQGTVVDENGDSVIGASVVVKGTTNGTITDIDGKFTLNVPADKNILVFTLVGMKQLELRATDNMRVVMQEDTKILDEVIVTAMGITREKKALGYAAQGVSAEDLNQTGNPSLSAALQGKVAGVQITPSSGMPGASSQIVLRGARSFKGDNTPLYVIDGMPIASTSNISTARGDTGNGGVAGTDYANRGVDIDPADIESIEVLKGQAAAALYGIRASNGVIIITTRSGKNLQKGKPQISVSSNVSFDKVSRYIDYQTKYAQGLGGAYDPYASTSWGPLISELPNSQTLIDRNDPSKGVMGGNHNGHPGKYYVPQLAAAGLDPWMEPRSYNNMKDFFDTGVTFNNSVSVAQATDKTNYSIFLSAANQNGVVPSTGMDRYTAKISADTKLHPLWNTGFVGTYVNTRIDKAPGANDSYLSQVYTGPVSYNLKGYPSHTDVDPYTQNHYRPSVFDNPYWAIDNDEFSEKTNRFYGNAYLNYATKLNSTDKKLNIKYQIGVDSYITDYTTSFGYGSRNSPTGQIELESWNDVTLNSLLTANFNWTINSDWTVTAIAGNEFIHNSYENKYESGANYGISGWNHIKNATTQLRPNRLDRKSKRTVGFFGDITASYKNMVYLGITGREDFVSNMPRNNRSFFYPSVNTSFVFTELDIFKDRTVLDFGKIRASYAEVGQAADDYRSSYYYKPSYDGGFYGSVPIQYPINGVNGLAPYSLLYDPNLKPQNTKSYEFGIDMTFLNSLFDVSFTYSRQNVTDQIFEVPLAASTGFQELLTNGGKIHTNSYEATLNVNPIKTKLIDWSFGFNFTKIDNYVDELADDVDNIYLGGFVTPQVRANIGDKFPVIWGSQFKRDDQGRLIVDEDGLPQQGEIGVIGKVSPDFLLGFNTNIRVQKFRIGAVFEWKSGGQMYHGTNGLLNFYGVGKDTENRDKPMLVDGVKEDGSKNDIEIASENVFDYYDVVNSVDEGSIYDTDYIKLRELSVGYTAFKNAKIEVGVNAFARNITIWSKLKNFDPESSQGNDNMAGAFERFSMPGTSSYGFGINVKF